MGEKPELENFIQVGLGLYVDALVALASFEGKLQERLTRALDAHLAAHRDLSFKPGATKTTSRSYATGGTSEPWISARHEGTLNDVSCTLWLGVWWRPPSLSDGTEFVLFACFNELGSVPPNCQPKREPKREGIIQLGHRFAIPYKSSKDMTDLAADAQLLLEEFASAFSTSAT